MFRLLVRRLIWPGLQARVLPSGTAQGQVVRDHAWITDDIVYATAVSNNIVYLGGSFTKVGPATGSMVALDLGTAAALKPYPQVLGSVSAVAPDANGGVYIGGTFTHVAGQVRSGLAHLDGNGNLTSWNPGINATGMVLSLALSGTTVYVGGQFTSAGGQPRTNLAALDGTTGLVTGWAPNPDAAVHAFAINGTTLYVGGFFSNIAGQARSKAAGFDLSTEALTGFSPSLNGGVYCMVASAGTVWVGGNFNVASFATHVGVAALDATTGGAFPWNPNLTTGNVYAMAAAFLPTGTTLFLGGDFSVADRRFLAAVDAGSGALSSFNPNSDGTVRSLSVSTGPFSISTVYAGGDFTTIGGQTRLGVAALSSAGTATSWNANASNAVYAIARSGSKLYVGGVFASVGWVNRNGMAAFDATSGIVTDWNPDPVGTFGNRPTVFALLVSGYTVYVGGYFSQIGALPRNSLAALDVATALALPWNPDPGSEGTVNSLALGGSVMYVGGAFNGMGGQPRENVAAVDASSGAILPFRSVVTGGSVLVVRVVTSISALNPPKLFLGGWFTTINGQPRNGLAQVNGDTGGLASWNPNPNPVSGVTSMIVLASVQGNVSRMYVGGTFASIGGQPRSRIAELDGAGVPTAWNPNANSSVHSLSLNGGHIYVGGSFSTIGGVPYKGLASIDVTTGLPTSWAPHTNGNSNFAHGGAVFSIQQIGGSVWAFGDFDGMLDLPHAHAAAVSADGAVTGVETETTSAPAVLPAGERSVAWDGRSDAGRPVSSAMYFLRVESGDQMLTSKVFRLK